MQADTWTGAGAEEGLLAAEPVDKIMEPGPELERVLRDAPAPKLPDPAALLRAQADLRLSAQVRHVHAPPWCRYRARLLPFARAPFAPLTPHPCQRPPPTHASDRARHACTQARGDRAGVGRAGV